MYSDLYAKNTPRWVKPATVRAGRGPPISLSPAAHPGKETIPPSLIGNPRGARSAPAQLRWQQKMHVLGVILRGNASRLAGRVAAALFYRVVFFSEFFVRFIQALLFVPCPKRDISTVYIRYVRETGREGSCRHRGGYPKGE
jgi:hypothetical protein